VNQVTKVWLKESWTRWLAWFLLALLFAVACGFLSDWQFNRRSEKVTFIQKVQQNYDAPAVALEKLVPSTRAFDESYEWRPVLLTGHYLSAEMKLVRNRPNNGQPGFLEMVPFVLNSGKTIAVSRGWLPTGNRQDSPDVIPLPDDQQRTLTARLRLGEPRLDRSAPPGQIAALHLPTIRHLLELNPSHFYDNVYVALETEKPSSSVLPASVAMPELDEGNHLSYALQWIMFAIMAFLALVWAVRKELHFKRLATDKTYVPKVKKRKTLGQEDNEIEDSLLRERD
jgi:cytochrome oxidase assembly protein ShyY1